MTLDCGNFELSAGTVFSSNDLKKTLFPASGANPDSGAQSGGTGSGGGGIINGGSGGTGGSTSKPGTGTTTPPTPGTTVTLPPAYHECFAREMTSGRKLATDIICPCPVGQMVDSAGNCQSGFSTVLSVLRLLWNRM